MKVEIKRGYAKWIDEDGVFHKIPEAEYFASLEPEKDDTREFPNDE